MELWNWTVAPEAARTEQWLADLAEGRFSHFKDAAVSRTAPASPDRIFGMCGLLQQWDAAGRRPIRCPPGREPKRGARRYGGALTDRELVRHVPM